jgi:hypothetical protein
VEKAGRSADATPLQILIRIPWEMYSCDEGIDRDDDSFSTSIDSSNKIAHKSLLKFVEAPYIYLSRCYRKNSLKRLVYIYHGATEKN